jgi:membrane fusion protein, heavy metal efflux system
VILYHLIHFITIISTTNMKIYIFLLFAVLLFACGKKTETDSHEHEAVSNQITLFTDSTEFYVEYSELVKGKEASFLVHTTRLSSYKPYTFGKVTVQVGESSVTASKPEEPGIFHLKLTPKESGHSDLIIIFESDTVKQCIDIEEKEHSHEAEAKESGNEEHNHAAEEEGGHEGHNHAAEAPKSGLIRFTKEQAWKSNFMVKEIVPQQFAAVINTSGEMLSMPGEKQNVAAKTSGIVLFATKNLVQGSHVTKGQLLFTISGQDLTDNNIGVRFSEARNRFLQSKSEYDRHKQLYNERIISEKQFIESQSRYHIDSISYYALSNSTSQNGLRIYAPLSGYLHELNISEGQYIQTGDLLATISTNQTILLRADLPQQYYLQLNMIETANFRPAYSEKTYTVNELKGRILARGASVAENNHYMPVYFEVKNDGSLLEGAFAEFYLITHSQTEQLAVPNSAIVEEQGVYYVYVQETGEAYSKRTVTLGQSNGLETMILSGLEAHERVVTQGTTLIKTASMSTSVGAHNHQH